MSTSTDPGPNGHGGRRHSPLHKAVSSHSKHATHSRHAASPVPLGKKTLTWMDNQKAYWESAEGSMRNLQWALAGIPLESAKEMALNITMGFEGSYATVAPNAADGQGMSFGIMQWNFGQKTLGPLLKKMLDADSQVFRSCFGPTADYDTLETALNSGDNAAEFKWAVNFQLNHYNDWIRAFQKLGSIEKFKQIQREKASSECHEQTMNLIGDVREMSPTLLHKVEFRSYAALWDLGNQQKSIFKTEKKEKQAMVNRIDKEKPSTQLDLMKIVVTVRGLSANHVWASDCISRRMGILTGSTFKSTEYGVAKARSNQYFGLIRQFGEDYVSGL